MIESSILKSCGTCRQAKKKCVFSPLSTECDRCLRLGKKCVRIHKKKTVDLSVVCSPPKVSHVHVTSGTSHQKGHSCQNPTSSKTPVLSQPSHGVSCGDDGPVLNFWHTGAEHFDSSPTTLPGAHFNALPQISCSPSNHATSNPSNQVHGGDDGPAVNAWHSSADHLVASHVPVLGTHSSTVNKISPSWSNQSSIDNSNRYHGKDEGLAVNVWHSSTEHLASSPIPLPGAHSNALHQKYCLSFNPSTMKTSYGGHGQHNGHDVNAWHSSAEHLASSHVPFAATHSQAVTKHKRKSFSKVKSKGKSKIKFKRRAKHEDHDNVDEVVYAIKKQIFCVHRWIPPPPPHVPLPLREQKDKTVRTRTETVSIVHSSPPWHVYKSCANSSKRTKAAHFAHEFNRSNVGMYHAQKRGNMKSQRQKSDLIPVSLPVDQQHCAIDRTDIRSKTVVIDGGSIRNEKLCEPLNVNPKFPWHCLRIRNGDLHVVDTMNSNLGLIHQVPHGCHYAFIHVPRTDALSMSRMDDLSETSKFCHSIKKLVAAQNRAVVRGTQRAVFSNHKYVCLGQKATLGGRGVHSSSNDSQIPQEEYQHIVNVMKHYEKVYFKYADTHHIGRIVHARSAVPYKTMSTRNCNEDNADEEIPYDNKCEIFSSMAVGKNVHLRCHVDNDFTHSVVTVHVKGKKYLPNDSIVSYFCFPRLGMAVALRPGDMLIFNPCEEHAISSRCDNREQTYSISFYLKTAIVGLNNNNQQLTTHQMNILKAHKD